MQTGKLCAAVLIGLLLCVGAFCAFADSTTVSLVIDRPLNLGSTARTQISVTPTTFVANGTPQGPAADQRGSTSLRQAGHGQTAHRVSLCG